MLFTLKTGLTLKSGQYLDDRGQGQPEDKHGAHGVFVISKRKTKPSGDTMKNLNKDKIDPERMIALRGLPVEIKQQITGEEARAFLHKEELPESLQEKLKGYIVEEGE